MPKSSFDVLEAVPWAKAAEKDRLMPREGVWSGVGGIRAPSTCGSLEGMEILRGVTGPVEMRGCLAVVAGLHIASSVEICNESAGSSFVGERDVPLPSPDKTVSKVVRRKGLQWQLPRPH